MFWLISVLSITNIFFINYILIDYIEILINNILIPITNYIYKIKNYPKRLKLIIEYHDVFDNQLLLLKHNKYNLTKVQFLHKYVDTYPLQFDSTQKCVVTPELLSKNKNICQNVCPILHNKASDYQYKNNYHSYTQYINENSKNILDADDEANDQDDYKDDNESDYEDDSVSDNEDGESYDINDENKSISTHDSMPSLIKIEDDDDSIPSLINDDDIDTKNESIDTHDSMPDLIDTPLCKNGDLKNRNFWPILQNEVEEYQLSAKHSDSLMESCVKSNSGATIHVSAESVYIENIDEIF